MLIQAAGCVRNLSVHPQNEFKIVQEGGIKPLVDLLRSPNYKVVEQAAVALRNLSVNDANKVYFGTDGALPPLIAVPLPQVVPEGAW